MKTTESEIGSIIYKSGKPVDEIAVVKSGTVNVVMPCGTFMIEEHGILGICELSTALHYYTYTASSPVVLERYRYSRADLDFLTDKIPELTESAISSGVEQIGNISAAYMLSCMNSAEIYDFIKKQYSEYCSLCSDMHIAPKELPSFDDMDRPDSGNGKLHYMSGFYSILRQITEGNIFVSQADFVDGFMKHLSNDSELLFRAQGELISERKKMVSMLIDSERQDIMEFYRELTSGLIQNSPEVKMISDAETLIKIEYNSLPEADDAMLKERTGEIESILLKLPSDKKKKTDTSDQKPEEASDTAENQDVDISELSCALDTILTYADCGDEINATFKIAVNAYKKLKDRDSMDDNTSKLRHTISGLFYKIYMQAFQVTLGGSGIPFAVKMFLDFGYVDTELAGEDNTRYMAGLVLQGFDAPEYQIFSFYDWLLAIYHGERMPSRNEFDMDFTESVHAQKMKGEIDKETEARMMKDRAQMVDYELKNLFPSADKMTFGRITSFTGLFSEKDVIGDLPQSLVTVNEVQSTIQDVRRRDFSVFRRETLYTNPEAGINKDFIHPEILPDVILMPVVGTRGVMWQEIEGKKRLSEGRIMLPVFLLEDLRTVVLHTVGEFRWELCKRMQGTFWNDVTDPSLTSEYFDYIQFYRKNQDLSQDMKDKIKASLAKAKNSYKEMFVRDYVIWIMFESEGLPRLNKISRSILFKYCPFNSEIREKLSKNPLYENELRYFTLHNGIKKHHFSNVTKEVKNAGKELPDEIKAEIMYLDM